MPVRPLLLVAAFGVLAPGAGVAQLLPMEFSAGGGVVGAIGDLGDATDAGWQVQGSLGLRVPLFPVGARAEAFYQSLPDTEGGDFSAYGAFLNATLTLPGILIRPYGTAGVGVIRRSEPDEDHPGHVHEELDSDIAYNLGAGLRLSLVAVSFFVEGRFLTAGARHQSLPLTVGIVF